MLLRHFRFRLKQNPVLRYLDIVGLCMYYPVTSGAFHLVGIGSLTRSPL